MLSLFVRGDLVNYNAPHCILGTAAKPWMSRGCTRRFVHARMIEY